MEKSKKKLTAEVVQPPSHFGTMFLATLMCFGGFVVATCLAASPLILAAWVLGWWP